MHSYSVIAHDNDIYITGGHSSNQCTVDIVSGLFLDELDFSKLSLEGILKDYIDIKQSSASKAINQLYIFH